MNKLHMFNLISGYLCLHALHYQLRCGLVNSDYGYGFSKQKLHKCNHIYISFSCAAVSKQFCLEKAGAEKKMAELYYDNPHHLAPQECGVH